MDADKREDDSGFTESVVRVIFERADQLERAADEGARAESCRRLRRGRRHMGHGARELGPGSRRWAERTKGLLATAIEPLRQR